MRKHGGKVPSHGGEHAPVWLYTQNERPLPKSWRLWVWIVNIFPLIKTEYRLNGFANHCNVAFAGGPASPHSPKTCSELATRYRAVGVNVLVTCWLFSYVGPGIDFSPRGTWKHCLNYDVSLIFLCRDSMMSEECRSRPTWSCSEPASSRLCCIANCSRSSSSSLRVSLCLLPSTVYPGGTSNTHEGITPDRHEAAAHRGEVKAKRWDYYPYAAIKEESQNNLLNPICIMLLIKSLRV